MRTRFIIAAVVIILILTAAGSAWWSIHQRQKHDAEFDAKQAKLMNERDDLKKQADSLAVEREEAIKRAETAEAAQKTLEGQVNALEGQLSQSRKRIAASQQARQTESQRAAQDLASIKADADARQRCENLCARSKKLGLIPNEAECGCK